MVQRNEILVLGAGVSGLTSGILLLREGYPVTIWAKDLPPDTTSNKAAALWQPFLSGPVEKVPGWSRESLDIYKKESGNPETGCIRTKTAFIFDKEVEDPWWSDAIEGISRLERSELPEGYVDGYEIDGMVIDTTKYMDYLVNTFKGLGGKVEKRTVDDIEKLLEEKRTVVNCTGLGSRELLGDTELYPSRGQIVKVKRNGFDYSLSDDEGPNELAYIIPRSNDIVLGGTEEANSWSLEVSEEDTKAILAKCAAIAPEFTEVEIIEIVVGLRPARKEIRLERQDFEDGSAIVHNYGHGGSGFTVAWGCAREVVSLVNGIKNE